MHPRDCSPSIRKPKLFREIRDNAVNRVIVCLGNAISARKYSRKVSDHYIVEAAYASKAFFTLFNQTR